MSADDDLLARAPKIYRLLREEAALGARCVEAIERAFAHGRPARPDVAATVDEARRDLATAVEDLLRGSLRAPLDPADLHELSAAIASFTRRCARAAHLCSLLPLQEVPPDLRRLVELLHAVTSLVSRAVEAFATGRVTPLGEDVRAARVARSEARATVLGSLESREDDLRETVLRRSLAEALDLAVGRGATVMETALRLATKHLH